MQVKAQERSFSSDEAEQVPTEFYIDTDAQQKSELLD
jgi:hypothetical protein